MKRQDVLRALLPLPIERTGTGAPWPCSSEHRFPGHWPCGGRRRMQAGGTCGAAGYATNDQATCRGASSPQARGVLP
jgi:hypothetical protein